MGVDYVKPTTSAETEEKKVVASIDDVDWKIQVIYRYISGKLLYPKAYSKSMFKKYLLKKNTKLVKNFLHV